MRLLPKFTGAFLLLACAVLLSSPRPARAQALAATTNKPAERVVGYRPSTPEPAALPSNHPLAPVLKYARQEQEYLRQAVQDFTCRLVKRERIDDVLQEYQYVDMSVREEVRGPSGVERPLMIFLKFIGPASVAGRRVLYVDGQNEGKMLVRNGGRHFDYVIARIDPNGRTAMQESLVPITQTGFNHILRHMIDILERHAQADPTGENTRVEQLPGAKINKRSCKVVRIEHPRKESGLDFHVANVFIDPELHVPVRVDFSDWPKIAGNAPPLLAEYTYTDLQLNVNLPDSLFREAQLKSGR